VELRGRGGRSGGSSSVIDPRRLRPSPTMRSVSVEPESSLSALREPAPSPSLFEIDAVFFDFDGVLVISEPTWWSVIKEVLDEHGRAIRARVDGLKLRMAIDLQIPDNEGLAAEVEKEVWKRAVPRIRKQSLADEKGIRDLVDQIRARGIKIGVVSSSDHELVEDVLTRNNIRDKFPVIIGGDDVTDGKPAPEGYEKAASEAQVDPGRCCAIEDSASGIQAAAAARMHVVQFVVRNEHAKSLAVSFSEVGRTIFGDAESYPDTKPSIAHPQPK
jgi:HAD superfamily hydrolase (TIGR01509 family)